MRLIRYPGNPVLKPAYIWEEGGVFNAGAVYHNELFHLLYRAVYGEKREVRDFIEE